MQAVASVRGRARVLISTVSSDAHMWNLVFLQLLIQEWGHEVRNLGICVPDDVILEECRQWRPDLLVISTVNGHGHIDGERLVTRLRRDPALRDLRVVIGGKLGVVGADNVKYADRLLGAGFDGVFESGAGIEQLRAFLGELPAGPARPAVAAVATGPGQSAGAGVPAVAAAAGRMGDFVTRARRAGRLIVQPRMGFGTVRQMHAGLAAVRAARAVTVGTITLDSYTRVGDHESARRALREGADLNGYPIIAHDLATTGEMVDGLQGDDFPIQVRHGSAEPYQIFEQVLATGLDATEGGPVSYCLPYSRVPLPRAVQQWRRCCALLGEAAAAGRVVHLESFGGCMLGQLCPPGLLVALSVLEGLFFRQYGVRSVSLSYAQQTHPAQDALAVAALRRLADEFLPDVDRHVVVYTYMGTFPRTPVGAFRALEESVLLARAAGAERLIVKTLAEAYRIPTIEENIEALEFAAAVAAGAPAPAGPGSAPAPSPGPDTGGEVYAEARRLIEATLELSADVGSALVRAFAAGLLDVPFCLHTDNANAARAYIDQNGWLRWSDAGRMPVRTTPPPAGAGPVTAARLLDMLGFTERRFDRDAVAGQPAPSLPSVPAQPLAGVPAEVTA